MNTWTHDDLAKINSADELQLSTIRQDGTRRNPVTIWVVRLDDDLYIRAVKGPMGKWFRHALESHRGHVNAGGVSRDVRFIEADNSIKEDIDNAYQSKYKGYGASIIGSTLTPQAQAATLKIVPQNNVS